MTAFRQNYKELDYEEALSCPADLFQFKYDGIWVQGVVSANGVDLYSRTDKHKAHIPLPRDPSRPPFIFVGEYMFGSQRAQTPGWKNKIFMFDLFSVQSIPQTSPYISRLKHLKVLSSYLTEQFEIAGSFRVAGLPAAWAMSRLQH